MKANSFYNKNRRQKPAHTKQFLGTDVRTVSQLEELKCSLKRKLVIAQKLKAFAEKVHAEEIKLQDLFSTNERAITAGAALREWTRAVDRYSKLVKDARIAQYKRKQKVHNPFKGLWAHPAAQK
jgi:hypothetical protein